jgi:hypothetical protein
MIRRLNAVLATATIRALVAMRLHRLLAWAMSLGVRERRTDSSSVRYRGGRDGRPTILLLQANRMEDDMRILCAGGEIRILELNEPWLGRLAYCFLPASIGGFGAYVTAAPRLDVLRGRTALRAFLQDFLPHFYRRIPVDAVVRTDFKLQTDFDWGAVSRQIGLPYVVLQRENMIGHAPGIVCQQFMRDVDIGRFEGDHVIVYNEHSKQRYIRAGTTEPDRISVLGCLRMDELIARTRQPRAPRSRRRLTLFAIYPWIMQVEGIEAEEMYRDVHLAVAGFAQAHPDVDVVVKLKEKDARTGYDEQVRKLLRREGIDMDAIGNLKFSAKGPAHDHIFGSDAVIALNSTTVIESAVAGCPVIVPFFASMRMPKYRENLKFGADLDAFDVARDRADLERLLEARMADPVVPAEQIERRWAAFEKHFHSRDGRARERVVAKLIEIASAHSPRASAAAPLREAAE